MLSEQEESDPEDEYPAEQVIGATPAWQKYPEAQATQVEPSDVY